MEIKNKNIIESKNKICGVCDNCTEENGITILGTFICNECIDNITNTDVTDRSYYKLKEKIKKILINKL